MVEGQVGLLNSVSKLPNVMDNHCKIITLE